jgi:hypothetical protein
MPVAVFTGRDEQRKQRLTPCVGENRREVIKQTTAVVEELHTFSLSA